MTAAPPPSPPSGAHPETGFSVPANASDEALADLIDRDVADRLVQGLRVELDRYMPAIGDPARRPLALDAAVDGALRFEMASGAVLAEAVDRLARAHPDLRRAIESTATITMLFGPSGSAVEMHPRPPERPIPSRFGRALPDGRGRYELVEPLGARRPARVFRAIDHLLSRPGARVEVAVKILGRAGDQLQLDDAIEEARLLRSLRHDAIVGLVDSGVSDDSEVFIVTEFVHGESLRQRVERLGRPDAVAAARMIASLAHAVGLAHRAGVIHCDLSPANILVEQDGRARLVDFGSAVHAGVTPSVRRSLRGTPGFMAAEQIDASTPAAPTLDVHALGALLFWLLTGSSANGRDAVEIDAALRGRVDLRAWRAAELARARTPRALARIVLAAIDRDPSRRPPDAGTLARRLDAWIADHTRSQLPWNERLMAWGRHRPRLALMVTAGVTAILTMALLLSMLQSQERPPRSLEYTLLAARADRAIAYAMSRFDRSLRMERDEARALLGRVPQILGTARAPARHMRAWLAGPEADRLGSLLAGLQVISQRHGEAAGVEALTLRAALATILLAQGRDPMPALRGGVDLIELLPLDDPVRSIANAVLRAANARMIVDVLQGAPARAGLPSPEQALMDLDAAIRDQQREDRQLMVLLLREQRDRLAAQLEGRPWPREASGGQPAGAGARLPR